MIPMMSEDVFLTIDDREHLFGLHRLRGVSGLLKPVCACIVRLRQGSLAGGDQKTKQCMETIAIVTLVIIASVTLASIASVTQILKELKIIKIIASVTLNTILVAVWLGLFSFYVSANFVWKRR